MHKSVDRWAGRTQRPLRGVVHSAQASLSQGWQCCLAHAYPSGLTVSRHTSIPQLTGEGEQQKEEKSCNMCASWGGDEGVRREVLKIAPDLP